jgi:hypothetical protein
MCATEVRWHAFCIILAHTNDWPGAESKPVVTHYRATNSQESS